MERGRLRCFCVFSILTISICNVLDSTSDLDKLSPLGNSEQRSSFPTGPSWSESPFNGHNTFSQRLTESQESINSELRSHIQSRLVALPVNNATKSFWLDTPNANPLAEVGSTGELTRNGDICIIGSGITGVSAAWHLSKMLHMEAKDTTQHQESLPSVVILEAREFCSGATGRNGGHLTRNVFSSFLSRQAAYNKSEALKTYVLEEYTSQALVRFITERKLEDAVDLVEGGHVEIFRTEKDEIAARRDYEAARGAVSSEGVDTDVRWIGTQELSEKYGVDAKLNYTAVSFVGHNLWPCKLVTELFKDTQFFTSDVDVVLHTKTPVTSISRRRFYGKDDATSLNTASPPDQIPLSATANDHSQRRRWTLHTPRGTIGCTYVVHATNGYAAHLLPFLAGIDRQEAFDLEEVRPPTGRGGEEGHPVPPRPHPSPPTEAPPPRGAYGIVPTRGQVGVVRAAVGASDLPWLNSWDGGGGGWEYWFPRYQGTTSDTAASSATTTGTQKEKKPLIILGGRRQFSGGTLEAGVADDSDINPLVSQALRAFLPGLFPSQFAKVPAEESGEEDPWEMEWTGIMGFTKTGEPFVGPVVAPVVPRNSAAGSEIMEERSEAASYEGQYIAAGYTGHGMPRAYACAEAVAGMIAAKIRGTEWVQPKWLPERYLTWATHA